ncbi:MAG TPA: hypothetical protein PKN54_05745 [Candidatus Cloacimonas acidaminovorans]|nr:hypothetical protein [Candidatus Cloacimonas acidaminovorans]
MICILDNVTNKFMGNRWFWLGAFGFLATISIWFRSSLFGFDSYATLSAIRFGWFDTLGGQPIANLVWSIFPDSLFVFKFIMFLSLFLSILAIFKLVWFFYDERKAWLTIFLLMGLSPVLLFGFGEFENEVLAYPFFVWSIYWFLTSKDKKTTIQSIVTFFLGLSFWFWPFYLTFFNFGVSSGAVEQNMFAGLLNFWFLLPFLFFIPLLGGRLKWFGLLALFLWLWNAKLFILLIPFVALAIVQGLILLEKHDTIRKTIYYLAFFCLIGWNIAFLLQQPTNSDWFVVDKTVELAKDNNYPIFNDWSYGYWLWSKGIKTKSNPGYSLGDVSYQGKGIYLTDVNLPCVLVFEKKEIARKSTKIWQCN